MNTLTNGPLPAKQKREVTKAGMPQIVFRCGVRDCPEKLGRSNLPEEGRMGVLQFAPSYFFAKAQNVWIKTKRPANRLKHHRDSVRDFIGGNADEMLRAIENEKDARISEALDALTPKATIEDLDITLELWEASTRGVSIDDLEAKERDVAKYIATAKRSKEDFYGAFADGERGPFVVRCGRCGRLSKITL